MLTLHRSDADVVRAVRSGQPERFALLVTRYIKDLQAIAFAYTRNQTDAEDIAQESFLRAFTNLEQLREPHNFRHWLLTIARNHAHQFWHERQRESTLAEVASASPDPTAHLEREEQRRLLTQHLDALEPGQREVLFLHYFAGRSTREIAGMLEIEREAVKKRLERARAALGASLLQDLAISDIQKHVQKVMAAVLALPLAHSAAAAAPISITVVALLPKAAMLLVAAVLGAVILLAFDRVGTSARPKTAPAIVQSPSTVSEPGKETQPAPAVAAKTGLCIRVREDALAAMRQKPSSFVVRDVPLESALSLLMLETDVPVLLSGDTLYVGARHHLDLEKSFVPLGEITVAP